MKPHIFLGLGFIGVSLIVTATGIQPATHAATVLSIQGGSAATPTLTVTSGPTLGNVQIGTANVACITATGKIDPPLGSGVVGTITEVKLTDCGGPDQPVPAADYVGGANGASFTVSVTQTAAGTSCKGIKITYTTNENPQKTYTVTISNPLKRGQAVVEFGSFALLPRASNILTIKVIDRDGNRNMSYNGTIYVNAFATGGSVVKLNGNFGTALVNVTEGLGTFAIDATTATAGDTVYFETHADRLDIVRSGIVVD